MFTFFFLLLWVVDFWIYYKHLDIYTYTHQHTHTHTSVLNFFMYLFFLLCVLIFSGGRTPNKRRQHGHRIHNKQGGGGGAASSSAPGEQGKLGSPELQAIDPNVATPPPHRRGPRRHSNGKGFVWKQVGFSECSKTCGGGKYIHICNHTFTQQMRMYTILAFNTYTFVLRP